MSEVRRTNPFRTAVNKLLKNKLAVVCLIILVAEILMVVFAPLNIFADASVAAGPISHAFVSVVCVNASSISVIAAASSFFSRIILFRSSPSHPPIY